MVSVTKRDRNPSETETGTQPGTGAVRQAALDGFGASLPKYVFDRAQSDEADAAQYHAPPKTPPKPAAVEVDEANVEVAPTTPPTEKKKDALDLQIEAALKAPSNTDMGPGYAELRRMRDGGLDGVATDPRKEERRRHTGILSIAAVALVAAFVAVGVAYTKLKTNPVPSTTTSASLPPSTSQPIPLTASAAPTRLPSIPSTTTSAPTIRPAFTKTVPVVTSAPSTTSSTSPAPTGSEDPLTHVLDKH